MRITSLTLRDLRRYREAQLDLAPGLTIVRGPNEAGKSTLQRAIELALTRKVTSSAADLASLLPWDGGEDASTAVQMAFTYEDEDGGIHVGTLLKRFKGAKGEVVLEVDGERVTDPARADELMAEISGVPTEGFFRSTASIRHHELAALQRDEGALRDRLQASISGADRGTSRARKKLERALYGLQTKGVKNPGRLKTAEDAVTDVSAKLEAGEDALLRLERDRDALAVARENRAEFEGALTERRAMLEKARQAERLSAEKSAAHERYERYRYAVIVRDEIAELDRTHPSPTPLPVLKSTVERLRSVDTKIRTLEEMLAGEIQVSFEVPPEVRWRPLSRWALVLLLLGVIIAVAGFVLPLTGLVDLGMAPIYVGAALAGIGLVLALVGFWLRRGDTVQTQLKDAEVNRRLRGRSEIELELRQAQAEHDDLLSRLGLETSEEADARLAAEEAHVAEIETRKARLSGLIGEEPLDALPGRRDAAALEIEQKTAALEALGPIAKEPRARERLEVEVADAERALDRARDDEATARARVEQNPVDAEEVAALAERLAGWKEELTALRRRERIYARTLQEINSAEQATMQRATRYLERRMVKDIDRITGGRYKRVRVDDTNLGIDVFSPERDDWVPVTDLSQGTLDTIYLAARLGLVRLVTGDRRPPLVLDDPFVTLDDTRAPRALELLREVSADFQVIYLTTSDRYDHLADKVVTLDGPTAADTHADQGEPAPA
ncbi:MAG TPA: AAA family ATPase [Candidatus Limnocylindrales bacterium]|nr:AAA family ATPase [Candidatus Limnocylindrales bacterium]